MFSTHCQFSLLFYFADDDFICTVIWRWWINCSRGWR